MKKNYFFIVALLSIMMNGQTITQSVTQTITNGNSVTCTNSSTGTTQETSNYRSFNLASFGITDAYSITSVEFGIETVIALGTVPITVNLYSTSLNFPASYPTGYTLIGSQTVDVASQTLTVLSVPITAVVPAGQKLVVEIYSPDLTSVPAAFLIGSNADGQTAPNYIAAAGCGLSSPVSLAAVGFPNMHIVMNVVGTTLGVNDYLLKATVVYPNPTTDSISIEVPNEVEITKVTLMDNTGKIFTKKITNNTISVNEFATGIYILTIETDKGTINRKIVKI